MRTIEHNRTIPIRSVAAREPNCGRRLVSIAICAVLVAYAPRVCAQPRPKNQTPHAAGASNETVNQEKRKALEKEWKSLADQSNAAIQAGRLAEAKAGLERALGILEQLYPKSRFPDGHSEMPPLLTKVGTIEFSSGKYPQALQHFRGSLRMINALAAPGDPWREANLESLALHVLEGGARLDGTLGEPDEADRCLRLAADAVEAMEPKQVVARRRSTLLALAWSGVSASLAGQNRFTEAEAGYRRALQICKEALPPDDSHEGRSVLAATLLGLGSVLRESGKSRDAVETLRKALEIWAKALPANDPPGPRVVHGLLGSLALALYDLHDLEAAEATQREALARGRRVYGDGVVESVTDLRTLGIILRAKGNISEAESSLDQALAIARKLFPEAKYPQGHPQVAATLGELGCVLADKGNYGGAMRLLEQSLAMSTGRDNLPRLLDELAAVHMLVGERDPAYEYAAAALRIREERYPKDRFPRGHRDLASSMLRLAGTLDLQEPTWAERLGPTKNKIDNVGELYRKALEMFLVLYPQKECPSGRVDLADALWWSGQYEANQNLGYPKDLSIAERGIRQCQRSLEMLEKLYPRGQYPTGHPLLAERLSEMGALLANLSEYESALGYAHRGLNMSERLYPRDRYPNGHPALVRALYNLGMVRASKGFSLAVVNRRRDLARTEFKLASDDLLRCYRMSQDFVYVMLGDCPEAEAWNFLSAQPPALELMISIPPYATPGWSEILYDAVAERKSTFLRASQRRGRLMAESKDPKVKAIAQKLEQTRRQLAVALLTATEEDMKHPGKVFDLTREKEHLERDLAERLPRYDPAHERRLRASDLKGLLPAKSALVEIFALRQLLVPEPGASEKLGRVGMSRSGAYHAFIVRPDAPIFSLEINRGVPGVGWPIRRWREEIAKNDPRSIESAYEMRDLVWQDIERHLGPSTATVYIAPDGMLSQIPWAALPGRGANRVLLEDYALAVVPNGLYALEQLASQHQRQDRSKGRFLGVGDVSYDRGPGPHDLPGRATTSRSIQRLRKKAAWLPLPGTRAELDAIGAIAGSRETTLLMGPEATAQRILDELPKARWAHLATHGFFDDPARFLNSNTLRFFEIKKGDLNHAMERNVSFGELDKFFPFSVLRSGNSSWVDHGGVLRRERDRPFERDPDAFSGIVLAGANLPVLVDRDGLVSGDGGIVTADAITNLPLDNLDLLVLSACETGLGDSGYSVGVMGLQRSFHAAGARNVVASLWKVDDDATAALMRLFYHKLWAESKSAVEALREAQLAVYYHPERVKDLARTRGVDFSKELQVVNSRRPEMVPQTDRAPTKLWAGFQLSGADPPTRPALRYNLADTMKRMGACEQDLNEATEAIRLKPDDVYAQLKLGKALAQEEAFRQSDHTESIDHFRRSIQLKPDLDEAHYLLGAALHDDWSRRRGLERAVRDKIQEEKAHEKLAQAVDALRHAVRFQGGNANWHDHLGSALQDQGKLDQAIEEFKTAIRLNSDLDWAHYHLGLALHAQGKLGDAIAAHRAAIRVRPDFAEAHHDLGRVLRAQHQLDDAIVEYRKAIQLKPDIANPHVGLGNVLRDQGKLDEAIAEYKEAMRLQPDSVYAHYGLGLALEDRRRFDAAIAEFREAIRLKPDHADAHNQLGLALLERADRAEIPVGPSAGNGKPAQKQDEAIMGAIAEFRQAIDLNPNAAGPHGNLGRALIILDRFDEAIVAQREAVRLEPDFADAHLRLGYLLHQKGTLDEAIAEYRRAIRFKPGDPWSHIGLGQALCGKGSLDAAIAEYRKAISLQPNVAETHCEFGNILLMKGQPVEAEKECREALRLDPGLADAHMLLGSVCVSQEKWDAGIRELREAIRRDPALLAAHANLATALKETGHVDEAIEEYKEAIKLSPEEGYLREALGYTLVSSGRFDEAITAYRESIGINPADPAVHHRLGRLLDKQGKREEAIVAFRESIRLKSDDPRAHYDLGTASLAMGHLDEATAALRESIRLKKDDAKAHGALGSALHRKGLVDEGIAEYCEAIRLDGKQAWLRTCLGDALRAKGRLDEAIAAYREAVRIEPDLADPHHQLGHILERQGKRDDAIAEFREAIRIQPNWAEVRRDIGRALAARGSAEEAIAQLREGVRIKPDQAEFYNELGIALNGVGRTREAITAYRDAIRLKPKLTDARSNLGRALEAEGKVDEAIHAYRDAIRLKPDNAKLHSALAYAFHQKRNLDDAIVEYRKAIQLKPDFVLAHYDLGLALQGLGDWSTAVDSFRRAMALAGADNEMTASIAGSLQIAQRMAALAPRLPAVLKNSARPANAAETADFGSLAHSKAHHATSARLYAHAFASDPKLGDDLKAAHRYNAACSAALAGCGQGKDDRAPDEAGRAKLRRQALEWLTADLVLRKRQLESGKPDDRAEVSQILAYWKSDRDLAGVREPDALAKLPQDEQKAWRALWAEVDALEKKARSSQP